MIGNMGIDSLGTWLPDGAVPHPRPDDNQARFAICPRVLVLVVLIPRPCAPGYTIATGGSNGVVLLVLAVFVLRVDLGISLCF